MLKSELRKVLLDTQKALSQKDRTAKSQQVIKLLFANFDFGEMDFLNCFVTFEKQNELDTREIFQRLWREFPKVKTCAPRVDFAAGALENVRVASASEFVENKWRILEPAGDELIAAGKLDAVLVPLLAFDERGYRVGYGKGFYDRFLKNCRADCQKIGLSFFPPVEKIADVADFDVRLDYCVTPGQVYQFE